MSRYVDADAIKGKAWKAESEACFYALEDVVSVTDIDDAPSIDIVRCKECKHWHKWGDWEMFCGHFDGGIGSDADDFCSWGERMKGTDDEPER